MNYLNGFRMIRIILIMQFYDFNNLKFIKNDSYEFIKNRKYIQVCKQTPHGYTIVHIVIYREDSCQDMNYFDKKTYISFSLYKEIQRYKNDCVAV